MVNYQNGKVYKIINENNEIVYIGSTAQELLCDRYKTHKYKALNHKIILIENYSCNSRQELCMREQQIIEEHSNLLNKQKAYSSEEEKIEYNKEYQKKWRENNKEKIKKREKEYYETNKEELNQKNKEYYENNKKELNQKSKKKYEENKTEILEKLKVKVNCPHCNCEIIKGNLKRHQKRNICLKFQKS